MVISHEHRYVFVELPNTASSAIHKELCEHYNGIPLMHPTMGRHIYYHEFLKSARAEERDYFVFSCIRNPLDVTVSVYFKFKTNKKNVFTNPELWKKNGGWVTDYDLSRFNFIQSTSADFPAYFKRFYRFPPYDNWSRLSHKKFDFIIRFENLRGDFARVLELLGLDAKRSLPVVNKTALREKDFWSYYTPEIRDQTRRVFGPFMKKWEYDFPSEWGDFSVPWLSRLLFYICGYFRTRWEWGSSIDSKLLIRFFGL
jgi:hypothetical protein